VQFLVQDFALGAAGPGGPHGHAVPGHTGLSRVTGLRHVSVAGCVAHALADMYALHERGAGGAGAAVHLRLEPRVCALRRRPRMAVHAGCAGMLMADAARQIGRTELVNGASERAILTVLFTFESSLRSHNARMGQVTRHLAHTRLTSRERADAGGGLSPHPVPEAKRSHPVQVCARRGPAHPHGVTLSPPLKGSMLWRFTATPPPPSSMRASFA